MKITIKQKKILHALQKINSILLKKNDSAILENILIQTTKNELILTSTNLEIEIIIIITTYTMHNFRNITVSGRKLLDICRRFTKDTLINITLIKNNKMLINAKNSRFILSTLPSEMFPNIQKYQNDTTFVLQEKKFKKMICATYFCMAKNDVRYYLNGMLLEAKENTVTTVSTDGHRMAICNNNLRHTIPDFFVIIPRKTILELIRLLDENSVENLKFEINNNQIRIYAKNIIFTSKIIEGHFPDYKNVLVKDPTIMIDINKNIFKESLLRINVLCNEIFRSVHLNFSYNQLKLTGKNQEEELSEEILEIENLYHSIDFSVNINYILDILNTVQSERIKFLLTQPISKIQIADPNNSQTYYTIMPLYT